jgi:hypothetical protein
MTKGLLLVFNLDRISYTVSNKNAEVTISTVFNYYAETRKLDAIPISGFPRALVTKPAQSMLPNNCGGADLLQQINAQSLDQAPFSNSSITPIPESPDLSHRRMAV